MAKKWKIYVHQNLINGKLYIGQTSEDNIKRRWHGGANYVSSPYFYNAIKKYGWDNFNHLVLIDNIETIEEANLIEKFLINKYKTNDRKFGYNIEEGGNASLLSKETKKKISLKQIEKHQNKPEVQKVKKEFEKIEGDLDSLKSQKFSTKGISRPSHKYICIETQKIYSSSCEAEKDTGIPARSIRAVCLKQQKSTRNIHWDYYIEGRQYELKDYIESSKIKSTKPKKVYCKELNITFNSGTEAAKYLGMKNSVHIFECCNNIRKTCQEFHWSYVKEEGEK